MKANTMILTDGLIYDFAAYERCGVCGKRVVLKSDNHPEYPEWEGECCGMLYQVRVETARAKVRPISRPESLNEP